MRPGDRKNIIFSCFVGWAANDNEIYARDSDSRTLNRIREDPFRSLLLLITDTNNETGARKKLSRREQFLQNEAVKAAAGIGAGAGRTPSSIPVESK